MNEQGRGSEKGVPSSGQWARDIATTYRQMADESTWEPRRNALYAEAAKYEGIAASMDRATRVTPPTDTRNADGAGS